METILTRFLLTDRVAIVTGSGTGIGKAIALAFAQAGADLVLAGINVLDRSKSREDLEEVAQEITALGRKSLVILADVRVADEVGNMVRVAVGEFGHIDILVNNAGGMFFASTMEMSENAWDAQIRGNLKPVFLCSKAVAEVMISQNRKGSIVNISSIAGRGSAVPVGTSAYGAAKAGIINMTQTLAVEWAPYRIRVNGVAPGMINTDGVQWLREHDPSFDARVKATVFGRLAEPEDVAAAALYLASDAADYVSGHVIDVCGPQRGYADTGQQ
ncbi:SDR family NAD(P)-dependent oxidoreductase [Chloroflexota bacterium]